MKLILIHVSFILLFPLALLFWIANPNPAAAQDFRGYMSSNYAGVNGIDLQPASIAGSRYKVDISLLGLNIEFRNNFLGFRRSAFNTDGASSDSAFVDKYLVERTGSSDKSFFFNFHLLLPSFMVSLDDGSAFAFTWKVRNMLNVDGMSSELAQLIFLELKYQDLWNKPLENKNLSLQTMTWAEYGISYGRIIRDDGKNHFKAGARVKLLQGIQAGYMFVDDLKYMFPHEDTLTLFNSAVDYGHSDDFKVNGANASYRFSASPAFGLDIGVVYEYRPDFLKLKNRDDKEKYKFKAGISLLDLGRIRFKKAAQSRRFNANVDNWYVNNINPGNVNVFDDTISAKFTYLEDEESFKMELPTALSVQADYHFAKDFYLNFTAYWAFQRESDRHKIHQITAFSLAPRWDNKWFGAYLPVSVSHLGFASLGVGLRFGPLIIGTNDLFTYLGKQVLFGADFYVILKVPIPHGKPPDRDKDELFDFEDDCPDNPGPREFAGCPDSDRDNILDKHDECPDIPGLVEYKGCPDRDGDKIPDNKDKCPDIPGHKFNSGCPVKLYLLGQNEDTISFATMNEDGFFAFEKLPENQSCLFLLEAEQSDMIDELQITYIDKNGKEVVITAIKQGERYFKFEYLPHDVRRLYLLSIEGDTLQLVNQNDEGFFVFQNLAPNQDYIFVLEDEDVEMIDDVLILFVDDTGKETLIVAKKDQGNIFKFKPLQQREARLYLLDEQGDTIMIAYRDASGTFVFENLPANNNYLFLLDSEDAELLKEGIKVALVDEMGYRRIVPMTNEKGGYFHYTALPQSELGKLALLDEEVIVMLREEEKKIVTTAFENIEFNTGSSVLSFSSFASLNPLGALLTEHPEWKLKLAGHTDNAGPDNLNMMLSKQRTEAVKKALVNRGITAQRILIKFFGETQPIGDNNTEEGRQRNRRVEMLIIK